MEVAEVLAVVEFEEGGEIAQSGEILVYSGGWYC